MQPPPRKVWSRRRLLAAVGGAGGALALGYAFRRRLIARAAHYTETADFSATPALKPHDPSKDKRRLFVGRDAAPADNVDEVLRKLGGIEKIVQADDVVMLKLSAQWWNQGMTNVAAAKRMIERIIGMPGFSGEVIVVENTHFRLATGSGLSRAWTHPSERNVDVGGWNKLSDLIPHFSARGAPVSFVGLVDAGPSSLSADAWHDPMHLHGTYGGDERGPIGSDDQRDGYRWDLSRAFQRRKSWLATAQTPLSWPVFTSPHSGLTVDLRDGIFQRGAGRAAPVERKLTWITMATVNEHPSTGITACCKSAMGIVDMSAGRMGTDRRILDYQSVHHFGYPNAKWRMAGPLAHFAREVRCPDLYLAVAEWVGSVPRTGLDDAEDLRLAKQSAHRMRTIVAGNDPVAIDQWCARHLLKPLDGKHPELWDVDDPESSVARFLRYYREVYASGTLDPDLIEVV